MKNRLGIGLGLLILTITFSCTGNLPLVLSEDNSKPLKIWVDTPPDSIGYEETEILFKYDWEGQKEEFETRQNAAGEINYEIIPGKSFGRRGTWRQAVNLELKEKGEHKFYFRNVPQDDYKGKGNVSLVLWCDYIDKDGKKHKGMLDYIVVPVIYK